MDLGKSDHELVKILGQDDQDLAKSKFKHLWIYIIISEKTALSYTITKLNGNFLLKLDDNFEISMQF